MIDIPVQVKDALRDGRLKKNYRFVVLNADGTESEIGTIDNNNLVRESVSIDERMCSGDTLKFGLCEGASLEFQYFDKPNITGKRVQAFIDVDYGEAEPYTIPMGFFDVKKCSRQASTGIIKVTAYNKLQSEYLDAKANDLLAANIEDEDYTGSISLYKLLQKTLAEFAIDERAPQVFNTNILTQPITHVGNIPPDTYQAMYDENHTRLGYIHIVSEMFQDGWAENNIYAARKVSDELKHITTALWEDFFDAYPQYEECYLFIQKRGGATAYVKLKDLLFTNEYDDEIAMVGSMTAPGALAELKGAQFWQRTSSGSVSYIETQYGINDYNTSEMMSSFKYTEELGIFITVPCGLWVSNTTDSNQTKDDQLITAWSTDFINNYGGIISYDYKKELTPLEQYRVTDSFLVSDVTLRELQSAVYESGCQFGQLSRLTDLFSGVELNRSALYPADTLYPDDDLYPDGAQESAFRSQYSKLWADEGNIHKWRNLIITYKGLDEQGNEKEYTLQRQVNADGTDDYNCSDNWLFRNLVWTSEQIAQYAVAMVAKMQPITWFPFEMWGAGLPYIETGDQIEIPLGEETYTSYILQRQLKGIQNLQDTYINGTLDIF